jgi:hypothetical protein
MSSVSTTTVLHCQLFLSISHTIGAAPKSTINSFSDSFLTILNDALRRKRRSQLCSCSLPKSNQIIQLSIAIDLLPRSQQYCNIYFEPLINLHILSTVKRRLNTYTFFSNKGAKVTHIDLTAQALAVAFFLMMAVRKLHTENQNKRTTYNST